MKKEKKERQLESTYFLRVVYFGSRAEILRRSLILFGSGIVSISLAERLPPTTESLPVHLDSY